MPNQIDRDVYVTRDVLKTPIQYVRGTDYLPIVMHFRDFNIPEDASAQVFIAKPSGNIFYGAATISGNDVTIATEEQMFIELGLTLMQISIQDNNKELISFAQPVYVSQNLKSGDLPDSTTDIKFLDQAIQEANEAVDTATTAAQQAAIAVQNANQAIQNANGLISELNEQVSSLNTNYASLVNSVSIPQLKTTSKTVVGAPNELNSNVVNSRRLYYDSNTNFMNDENRKNAIEYAVKNIIGGLRYLKLFAIFEIRYSGGYYHSYIIIRGVQNVIHIIELTQSGELPPVVIWIGSGDLNFTIHS